MRDIPFERIASLAEIPGVQLISLQKDPKPDPSASTLDPQSVIQLSRSIDQEHGAFMDTAAIMMNLDLVITSDTSIPHLAGALGVPVWLALPFVPNWRWLLHRPDSPWYPTMRVFRQTAPGDWQSVFAKVQTALSALVTPR